MKYILILTGIVMMAQFVEAKKNDDAAAYKEMYRDQLHFSPLLNKMGAPLSVVAVDSAYLLYFQYNNQNLIDGYYGWGMARSNDLIHWEAGDMVLKQPPSESDSMKLVPWWGTVVPDKEGYRSWFNRWETGIFHASSKDGINWQDEVAAEGIELLKGDPFVFWHEATQKWVMFVYNRDNKTIRINYSTDGLSWKESSAFQFNFGFPQILEVEIDRKADETSWLLLTDEGTYLTGDFDGENFRISKVLRKFNHGRSVGASIMFKDPLKDRIVLLTGLKNKQMADLPSNGRLSFPTSVRLHKYQTGVELLHEPLEEISQLFEKTKRFENVRIYPGLSNNLLKRVKGDVLHIKGVIDRLNSDSFGFWIRQERNGDAFDISYDARNKVLNVLASQIDYEPENGKMAFELIIDRSSIEMYIDHGRYVVSNTFEPDPGGDAYELFTKGGEIMVEWMEVSTLKSIWE